MAVPIHGGELRVWASLLLLSGCGPTPEAVAQAAMRAASRGDAVELTRCIDPGYLDGLGTRARLLSDIEAWARIYPVRSIQGTVQIRVGPVSRARADALVDLRLALTGARPVVRAEGPVRVELVRDGVFRIRSGFLTEVRDALNLLHERRAALEANDVDAIGQLLHPDYRDGTFYDRKRLLDELRSDIAGRAVRIEPIAYRIELRKSIVHVDERYRMTIDSQPLAPNVARLTLAPVAGRLRIRAGLRPPAEGPKPRDRPPYGP